jgi:hypothetical protein
MKDLLFTRPLSFILLCIPARLLIAWGSKNVPKEYLKLYSLGLLGIAFSFLYLFFTNGRLIAPEAGGNVWWKDYRLIIGTLYLISAVYGFKGRQDLIWIPLIMDLFLGILLFFFK